MNNQSLIAQLHIGSKPNDFDGLDPNQEKTLYDEVNKLLDKLSNLVETKENCRLIINTINILESLGNIKKLIEQPVNINIFRDKNDNQFLQARTTFNHNGKTKWVNAYVGSIKQYPKGVNDPDAIKKGQILIRQKIKSYFGIK
jgi:hypothetical protein